MKPDSTAEDFFNSLPKEEQKNPNFFNEPKEIKEEAKASESPDKDEEQKEEVRKNRRHRRLEEQLEREREARIAAEARAQALSENRQFSQESKSDDIDPRWITIYGDTPASRQAWKLQQEIFSDYASKSKEEVLNKIQEEQKEAEQYQKQFESFIDTQFESIEDEYDVDITSNSPQARKARRDLLDIVETLSPKDEDGTISNYADFKGAWEMYQLKNAKPANTARRDEIAAKSMSSSAGVPNASKESFESGLRQLRELGIQI